MKMILGGTLVGIFLGAFAVEVLHRLHPELAEGIEQKGAETARRLLAAFRQGCEEQESGAAG